MSGLTQGRAAAASVTGRAFTGQAPTLYLSNGLGGTVTPIATATNTAGQPIQVGRGPGLIVITPDGKTAYVTGDGGGVTPIATATNTAGRPIEVGRSPDGKAANVASAGRSERGRPSIVTPIARAGATPRLCLACVVPGAETGLKIPKLKIVDNLAHVGQILAGELFQVELVPA